MIASLAAGTGIAPYLAVMAGAMIEGEIMFVTAATLVSAGLLDPFGVLIAGTLGASAGDQFFFFSLRGRLHGWVERFPKIARRGHALVARVRRHERLTIFAIRFSPGLRIALAAACAYANIRPLRFATINALSSVIWAGSVLLLVAFVGPRWLPGLGISGWWAAIVPALLIVLAMKKLEVRPPE